MRQCIGSGLLPFPRWNLLQRPQHPCNFPFALTDIANVTFDPPAVSRVSLAYAVSENGTRLRVEIPKREVVM